MYKLRKFSAGLLLAVFLVFGIPAQSRAAAPLALIPVALIGTALAIGAGAAGQYYAPAVYDSAHLAAASVGNVARQVYYGQKFLNSVAGDYFYGAAASLVANVGGFLDYLQSKAAQIPALWAQIQAACGVGIPFSAPDSLVGSTVEISWSSSYLTLPCQTQLATPQHRTLTGITSTLTSCGSLTNPSAFSCLPNFIIISGAYSSVQNMGPGSLGCSATNNGYLITRYSTVAATVPDTEFPSDFDSAVFASGFVPSADIAAEIDQLANDPDSPPGFLTPAAALPSLAAAGGVAPPDALTQSDLDAGLAAIQADIAADRAAAAAAAAAADPLDAAAQIAAAEAAAAAAEAAAEAEQPDVILPTLPVVDPLEIDFTPITAVIDDASNRFPFTLPGIVSGWFSALVVTAQPPRFLWQLFGSAHYFDLSICNDAAAMFRGVVAFFFHCGVCFFIIKRWT